jgi:hypothetical protein
MAGMYSEGMTPPLSFVDEVEGRAALREGLGLEVDGHLGVEALPPV